MYSKAHSNLTLRRIPNDALCKDVEDYSDSYQYEHAQQLNRHSYRMNEYYFIVLIRILLIINAFKKN